MDPDEIQYTLEELTDAAKREQSAANEVLSLENDLKEAGVDFSRIYEAFLEGKKKANEA